MHISSLVVQVGGVQFDTQKFIDNSCMILNFQSHLHAVGNGFVLL